MSNPIRPNDRSRAADLTARGETTSLNMTAGLVAGALSSVVAEALAREAAAQTVTRTADDHDGLQTAAPPHDGDGQQTGTSATSPEQPAIAPAAAAQPAAAAGHSDATATAPGQDTAASNGSPFLGDHAASMVSHAGPLDLGSAPHSSLAAPVNPASELSSSVSQMVERIVSLTGQDISSLHGEISGIADSLAQSVIQASSRVFGELHTLTQDVGATVAAVTDSTQSLIDDVTHLASSLPPTLLGAVNDGILDNSLINVAFGDGAAGIGHQIDATVGQVAGIAAPILHSETGHDGGFAPLSGGTDAVVGLVGVSYTDIVSHDGAVGHVSSLLHGLV